MGTADVETAQFGTLEMKNGFPAAIDVAGRPRAHRCVRPDLD